MPFSPPGWISLRSVSYIFLSFLLNRFLTAFPFRHIWSAPMFSHSCHAVKIKTKAPTCSIYEGVNDTPVTAGICWYHINGIFWGWKLEQHLLITTKINIHFALCLSPHGEIAHRLSSAYRKDPVFDYIWMLIFKVFYYLMCNCCSFDFPIKNVWRDWTSEMQSIVCDFWCVRSF